MCPSDRNLRNLKLGIIHMKVFLNRQEICVGSRVTLKELLLGQSISPEGIAVAVNNRIISKDEWAETFLSNNDKVTVIHAACGG